MTSLPGLSHEEDLGLDDVESFQEFKPFNRKIKLNRTIKPVPAEESPDLSENNVNSALRRGSQQNKLPAASVWKNKQNGSSLEEKHHRVSELLVSSTAHRSNSEEKLEESKRREDIPKRFSREKSLEARDRESKTRKHDSRSKSRDRESRRRQKSPRKSHSQSKSKSPPSRHDRPARCDNLAQRNFPPTRDIPPSNTPYTNSIPYFTPPEVPLNSGYSWQYPPPPWMSGAVDFPYQGSPEDIAKKLALEKEAMQQKMTFVNQQIEYKKKRDSLLEEIKLLKDQRRNLSHVDKPDVFNILAENKKLEEETMGKLKSVENVLDMLQGLIGDDKRSPERIYHRKHRRNSRSRGYSSDSSEEKNDAYRTKRRRSKDPAVNYVFYDPEVHWCKACNAFPATAKEYLIHLHSEVHRNKRDNMDLPWHDRNEHKEPVMIEGLPSKRMPIRGLQFFTPADALFCNLCSTWMGDLHCASLHLKSQLHAKKYSKFLDSNPKWEKNWLWERSQSLLASGLKEDILKRQHEEQLLLQKKHEDELKSVLESSPDPSPAMKSGRAKKDRKSKGVKKRKRRQSSSSSSSSSSSESSCSSSSSDNHSSKRRKKSSKQSKEKTVKVAMPVKSRWENDSSGSANENAETPKKDTSAPVTLLPEKYTIFMPESPPKMNSPPSLAMRSFPISTRTKKIERSREVDSKNKKEPVKKSNSLLLQDKFGFIGRMPFARKLKENEGKSERPTPMPPPPPVISYSNKSDTSSLVKTKVANAKNILTKFQKAWSNTKMQPVDPVLMELDIDSDQCELQEIPFATVPPPPPKIRLCPPEEAKKKFGTQSTSFPLPQDFQEALNIIYSDKSKSSFVPVTPPPPGFDSEVNYPPTPSPPKQLEIEEALPKSRETEEMTLLGIDREDMAAQKI